MNIPYNEYIQFIQEMLRTRVIALSILSLIFVPIIVLCMCKFKDIILRVLFGMLMCLIVVAWIWGVVPCQMDISKSAIEKYSGEYSSKSIEFVSRGGAKIEITFEGRESEKFNLSYPIDNIIENTTHQGVIVYSKHTKILFYMN